MCVSFHPISDPVVVLGAGEAPRPVQQGPVGLEDHQVAKVTETQRAPGLRAGQLTAWEAREGPEE